MSNDHRRRISHRPAIRRAAVEAGRGDVISSRDADDLLRDAEAFHHVVEAALGLPYQQVLPGGLPVSYTHLTLPTNREV